MNGDAGAVVGRAVRVDAVIDLAQLSGDDVTVQLYYGPLDQDGQLNDGTSLTMDRIETVDDNHVKYGADMPCSGPGMVGYTVRILPANPLLAGPLAMGMIRWA